MSIDPQIAELLAVLDAPGHPPLEDAAAIDDVSARFAQLLAG